MSTHFDVFNGDADGLCALHQLRLAHPMPSCLVTGVKRDNALLGEVRAGAGDSVTVLDLPLSHNRAALIALLEAGVEVDYFDHHHAPDRPAHPRLKLCIDTAAGVCTSVLVNRHLEGRFRAWAVVGAFGDNMAETAQALASSLDLDAGTVHLLKGLGECLNYNGYGDTEADVAVPPLRLYALMAPYADPRDFLAHEEIYPLLAQRRAEDMAAAMELVPLVEDPHLIVVLMPDESWARRVIGAFANRLKNEHPARLCAVLAPNSRGTLTVSLRTPEGAAVAADRLARMYGGDGRTAAAGINNLPTHEVPRFVDSLRRVVS